jgi:hypothetical protein
VIASAGVLNSRFSRHAFTLRRHGQKAKEYLTD